MAIFSKQEVRCRICGVEFEINFCGDGGYGAGECCSKECAEELRWRQTLSMLGQPYRPKEPKVA